MLYRGVLGNGYSGSVDGLTASHCRGSRYFRARVVPINPNTTLQQNTRQAMTSVSEDWGSLGSAYWTAWEDFANSVRRVNTIGDASNRTGFNEYVRWASARYFANLALGTDLPMFPAIPTGPQIQIDHPIEVAIESDGTNFHMQIDPDIPWFQSSDNALLVWVAAGRGAAEPPIISYIQPQHHYFRGPWVLVGMIRGEGSNSFNRELDNAMVPGQKLPWKVRLSSRYQGMSGEVGGHAVAT